MISPAFTPTPLRTTTLERQDESQQPDANPEAISAPAGAVDQQTARQMAMMRLQGASLPRQQPYQQVGPSAGGLSIQFAAGHTPQQATNARNPLPLGDESDDARDPGVSNAPSRAPGTYMPLDDAKELFSHMTSNTKHPEHHNPPDITRGYTPKWDHGKDKFQHFEHNVELYMKKHNIHHLLRCVANTSEESVHAQAVMIITTQLKKED